MKILVTGGTGLIGSHLIPSLVTRGHEVSVLTRNENKAQKKFAEKINFILGNPTKQGSWVNELASMDVIINLVGANILKKRWSKKRKIELYDSRILSKNNILDALKNHISNDSSKKYLLISPSGVDYYPQSEIKEFVENDPVADNFIGKLCKDWEPNNGDLSNSNIRIVVFRLGVVFTSSGKGAEMMFLPHKFFIGSWLGNGKQHFSFIHIDDLVGAIIWALDNKEIHGTFNLVSPETLSLKETTKIGGKIMKRWTWLFLPGFILRIILGKRADLLLKGRKVSGKKIQDAGYTFLYPTIESALTDILGKKNNDVE
ncbi:MAG: Epimerase family protein [Candidatus Heimdallarchaeota archaeon LC_2]|nr:MAG: Epimerase family protein [Candidatus Heimdallarchaeota archaeon LC_2]